MISLKEEKYFYENVDNKWFRSKLVSWSVVIIFLSYAVIAVLTNQFNSQYNIYGVLSLTILGTANLFYSYYGYKIINIKIFIMIFSILFLLFNNLINGFFVFYHMPVRFNLPAFNLMINCLVIGFLFMNYNLKKGYLHSGLAQLTLITFFFIYQENYLIKELPHLLTGIFLGAMLHFIIWNNTKNEAKTKILKEQLEENHQELKLKIKEVDLEKKESSLILKYLNAKVIVINNELKIEKTNKIKYDLKSLSLDNIFMILGIEKDKDKINSVFSTVFDNDLLTWEANNHLLPQLMEVNQTLFQVEWSPVFIDEQLVKIVIVIRSVKELNENLKEREEQEIETKLLVEMVNAGKEKTINLLSDCFSLLESIKIKENLLQNLHTLKGNARILEFQSISSKIHELENLVKEDNLVKFEQNLELLIDIFNKINNLAKNKLEWSNEFSFNEILLQSYVNKLAKQLEKEEPYLKIDLIDSSLFFDKHLFDILIHLINNSMDHGIETKQERLQKGKSANGFINIYQNDQGDIIFQDDGRGINSETLINKAKEKNLTLPSNIFDLLFVEEFSTKDEINEISGRGVGLAAVKHLSNKYFKGIKVEQQDYLTFTIKK